MTVDVRAARSFLYGNARLLERQVYAALFEAGKPAAIVPALAAYRNSDGGFGHGLEPDKRVPTSQALDVEAAFERLVAVNADATELVEGACDWLSTIAAPSGAVPILMPDNAEYPRAAHWTETNYLPGLNPTGAIVAHANSLQVRHPWIALATSYCFGEIEAGRVEPEGHSLLGLSKFLESAPDRTRAAQSADAVRSALDGAAFFKLHAASDAYGVTPLHFAPTPDHMAASWFDDGIIDAHLDALEGNQQADGGWTIAWEPISSATHSEWRGILTVNALQTLNAHGRL